MHFQGKAGVTTAQVKALTDELVESSRKDEGNKGYDLFESTTQPGVYMFCESWENAEPSETSCSLRALHSDCSGAGKTY